MEQEKEQQELGSMMWELRELRQEIKDKGMTKTNLKHKVNPSGHNSFLWKDLISAKNIESEIEAVDQEIKLISDKAETLENRIKEYVPSLLLGKTIEVEYHPTGGNSWYELLLTVGVQGNVDVRLKH